ncbi:histidine kinase [Curtobacterium sp. UCD-KPL2560]|uniref:sensor histidine kinase n=1 Tax=Curtobacterium sp. UCD-KPL2560 TaxID=1885315 RepID=UPI000825C2FB|nr:histidine kinase [Curtobacterium sp. UCD-KPL2560]
MTADEDRRDTGRTHRGTRWSPFLIDVVLVLVSASYSALSVYSDADAPSKWVLTMIAAAGLLLRRRWPYVSLVLALPGFEWGFAVFAVMFALYSVARSERRTAWIVGAAVVAFCCSPSWRGMTTGMRLDLSTLQSLVTAALFSALYVAAPTALGVAIRVGAELRQEIRERAALQQQRARLAAEHALERERAVLAREMHDVVSNQVSLIAVQAGALQVASPDATARRVAATIRGLSVTTLDELRAMIEVLRAAGGADRGPAPQPTLADLPGLLEQSGIAVDTHVELDRPLPSAVQRAVFRLVQEGLTNARKHAPGAAVHLTISTSGTRVSVELVAEPPQGPPLDLPSAHHGLVGLRERAELLGGSLERHLGDDGTHTLRMTLPAPRTTTGPPAPDQPDRRPDS